MRSIRPLFAALLASLLSLAVLAGGASAATPKTVIFDLFAQPLVKPEKVFLTANSGPYLKDLEWSGWGTKRATGTGTWIFDCTSGGFGCGPDSGVTTHPVTYVLSRPAACPRLGAGARMYRSGAYTVDNDGTPVAHDFSSDYDFCAKRPTRAAGRAAVRRWLGRHGLPKTTARVACAPSDRTTLDCTAHWTKGGKPGKRGFYVFGRMHHLPGLTPYNLR